MLDRRLDSGKGGGASASYGYIVKISIIVPVYNVAPYLRECLESIAGRRVEVICVDDGSTDGSAEILDEFQRETNGQGEGWRIVVVHQANAGVAAARNAGLEQVTGEWVMFLDGDDMLRPGWFAAVSRAIEACPAADAVHYRSVQFEDGATPQWGTATDKLRVHRYGGMVPEIFLRDAFFCKVYSRRLIGETRFRNYVWGEDRLFLATCLARAETVVEIDAALIGYRQRAGSATHSALSSEKLCSHIGWLADEREVWLSSGRTYPSGEWRKLAQYLTELTAMYYFEAERSVRMGAWPVWARTLKAIRGTREFPRYNRVVLRIFGACPCKAAAFLLFYVPHWLKRHGVHR